MVPTYTAKIILVQEFIIIPSIYFGKLVKIEGINNFSVDNTNQTH